MIADGKEYIATLVSACSLSIGEYRQSFDLLKAPIAFDVILGKPWLERTNPDIDWPRNTITFRDDNQKQHTWRAIDSENTHDLDDILLLATQLKKKLKDPSV